MDDAKLARWNRGLARFIMQDGRARLRAAKKTPGARVAFASDHYTLAKRYLGFWWRPVAAWHMACAARQVNLASRGAESVQFNADQVDVMTTIWAKVPRVLGGNRAKALDYLESALALDFWDVEHLKPHTRALMLISLGGLVHRDDAEGAWKCYEKAEGLIPAIEKEDASDRAQQLVRVLSAVGFFYIDNGAEELGRQGRELVRRARVLAGRVSKDQLLKIQAGCRQRYIKLW